MYVPTCMHAIAIRVYYLHQVNNDMITGVQSQKNLTIEKTKQYEYYFFQGIKELLYEYMNGG